MGLLARKAILSVQHATRCTVLGHVYIVMVGSRPTLLPRVLISWVRIQLEKEPPVTRPPPQCAQ